MNEEKNINPFNTHGQSPIPVPPVDEVWPLMKQKLDLFMPSIPWYRNVRRWKFVTAAAVSTALTVAVWVAASSRNHPPVHHQTAAILRDTASQTIQPDKLPEQPNDQTKQSGRQKDPVGSQPENPGNLINPSTDKTEQTNAETTQTRSVKTSPAAEHPPTGDKTRYTYTERNKNLNNPAAITRRSLQANNSKPKPEINKTKSGNNDTKPNGKRQHNLKHYKHGIPQKSDSPLPDDPTGLPSDPRSIAVANAGFYPPARKRGHNHSHPAPVYEAISFEKSGTDYSNYRPQISDSILKSIRSATRTATGSKESIVSKNPVLSSGNILRRKKTFQNTGVLMTAGLTIGKSFPIGQQHSVPYNVNGGSSTLSDYVPAPYFRYFINDRIYLEGAFQFNSPQYTRSQTIDSTSDSIFVSNQVDLRVKRLSLEKLYYSTIPLTFHYRLSGSLYIGAGIQYSRLWGGIAQQDTFLRPASISNTSSDSGISSTMVSIKNNAEVYAKFKKGDWRVLFEVSYTWRRFNLGIRYQQGLSPYLSVLPDGSKGKNRNNSLNLHLDYDIWQKRR